MTNNTDNTNDRKVEQLIYKELSYKLVGLAYEVCNTLGEGLKEEVYKDAYALLLDKEKIPYAKEYYYSIKIRDEIIAKRFFDFLIDDKIIVEFKVGGKAYFSSYKQLLEYLKSSKYKLGLIIRFSLDGVKIKRIPNLY
ncbi:MAG: GxxExxY protein [Patescibacteria group bacterium]